MTNAELTLVKNHLHLVRIIAQTFILPWYIERAHLISAGNVALIKAAQAYKGDVGKFSSFAWKCIKNAMLDEIEKLRPLAEKAPKEKESREELRQNPKSGAKIGVKDEYDYEHEHWNTYAGKAQPRNAEEYAEGTGDRTERLCSRPSNNEAWKVVDRLKRSAGLTDREAYVIDCRYGIGCEPRSTNQIAAELGVTPQMVNVNKREALRKMRLAA